MTTKLFPGEQRTVLPWEWGNRSPGINRGAGRQEEQAAFPTALAASLQQLPRKHVKLISHAPAPALLCPAQTGDDSYCPCSKDTSDSLMPSVQSQTDRSAHPSHCSPHPSLKIPNLSPDCFEGSEWPVTTRLRSGLRQRSLPSAVPGLSRGHRSPACSSSWGREAWKGRAALESGDAP